MPTKLINWTLFIILILLFINLLRSVKLYYRRTNIINSADESVRSESEKTENLKRELAKIQSEEFVERQARNKLNLVREGEIVVIIPTFSPLVEPRVTQIDHSSNLEKWWRVFF